MPDCFRATTPVDVVKTRMQGTRSGAYKNTLDCFVQIFTKEGPLMFYSGGLTRAARVIPGQGIIFMSAEVVYHTMEDFMWPERNSA